MAEPVHTATCSERPAGTLAVEVAVHVFVNGS
jgi:hypothetical protein